MKPAQSICAVGLLMMAFAAGAEACSGPGASMAIARNMGIGYAGFIMSSLILIPVVILRSWRRGFTVRALLPVALLVVNPAWVLGSMGDCGHLRASTAQLWVVATGVLLPWELVMQVATRKAASHALTWRTWLVCAILASAAGIVWQMSWTLDPLPHQPAFLEYSYFHDMRKAQDERKARHGLYAATPHVLVKEQRMDERSIPPLESYVPKGTNPESLYTCFHLYQFIEGTADDPTAWRVEGGLTNWALIARPVGFPEQGSWVQYLMLSDGSVWTKADPRTGKFLVNGVPADLRGDGWTPRER